MGQKGGMAALVDGMRANREEYQVQVAGVRCMAILIQGSRPNTITCVGLGAEALLLHVLETNPHDGQLQYRGQMLLGQLRSLTPEELEESAKYAAKRSLWARLRDAVLSGRAVELARGTLHGVHGVSDQVARVAQRGIKALMRFLLERLRSAEAVGWILDALSTMLDTGTCATPCTEASTLEISPPCSITQPINV